MGQDIFREAFNRAFDQHFGDEATAFRIASKAVKRKYQRVSGGWVEKP